MQEPTDVEGFFKAIATRTWDVFKTDPALYIVGSLLVVLVGAVTVGILAGPLLVGFIDVVAKRMRGEAAGIGDIFGRFDTFLTSLLVTLIVVAGVTVGALLLVVPGLIVALFTMFAFPAIALGGAGVGEALSSSARLVRDNLGNTALLFVALVVLSSIGSSVVFGTLLTAPLSAIALTVAYEGLTSVAAARTPAAGA